MRIQKELLHNKKALLVLLSIMLIIGCITGSTFAWLWSQTNSIVNTFSSSNLVIDLAETTGDTYKLVPGDRLAKNPSVTLKAGSEPAYVFLKADETDTFANYADYYIENGWQPYGGFVVDGELDDYYNQETGWYFTSWNDSFPGLEAYYSIDTLQYNQDNSIKYYRDNETYARTYKTLTEDLKLKGDDYARHALEMYVAYDNDYVYVYAKIYDNDYYLGPKYTNSNQADYFSIYWDPDPESRLWATDESPSYNLTQNEYVSTQGEAEIKLFPPADGIVDAPSIGTIPSGNKIGYGTGSTAVGDYITKTGDYVDNEGANCAFFEFYEGIDGTIATKDGEQLLAGYGYELRLPRNDSHYAKNANGNPYFLLNVAATSHHSTYANQCTLSFGNGYWIEYGKMLAFELNDANSPFAAANTQYYYKKVGDVNTGTLTEDVTMQILRDGAVFGEDFADGYVQVHTDLTTDDLSGVTKTDNVSLSFDAIAIQQAHLTLDDAYELAYAKWNPGS